MQKTSYIEFVGPPGTGKTLCAHMLRDMLCARGFTAQVRSKLNISIFTKIQLIFRASIFFIKTPSLWLLFFHRIRLAYRHTAHVRSIVRNLRMRLLLEVIIIRFLLKKHPGILINDEGMIGRLVALSVLTTLSRTQILKLCDELLVRNTCVVYIDTPPADAIVRESERDISLPIFDSMDTALKANFFTQSAHMYALIVSGTCGIQSHTIHNTKSQDALHSELKDIPCTYDTQ